MGTKYSTNWGAFLFAGIVGLNTKSGDFGAVLFAGIALNTKNAQLVIPPGCSLLCSS
jgi:hypothetical protein